MEYREEYRDCSNLAKYSKEDGIKLLAKFEQEGTLNEFIKSQAPDYIDKNGQTESFLLITDLGWW